MNGRAAKKVEAIALCLPEMTEVVQHPRGGSMLANHHKRIKKIYTMQGLDNAIGYAVFRGADRAKIEKVLEMCDQRVSKVKIKIEARA